MFVIQKQDDGYYFHNKGKIILFETPHEASNMLQGFYTYSMERMLQEQGPTGIFELQNLFRTLKIKEQDFEEEPLCGVILFKDLKNKNYDNS